MSPDRTCADCGGGAGNMVALVEHAAGGCSPVLRVEDLTPGERSTLMYIESCVVDERGRLDREKMNHEDRQNIKLLQAAGAVSLVDSEDGLRDLVVRFSDAAWDLARDCRQIRASRRVEHDADLGDVPGVDA